MVSVRSKVAYVNDEWRHADEAPRIFSRASREQNTSLREVEIFSARDIPAASALDLNREGYQLLDHQTAFSHFHEKEKVLGEYFPEMRELLLEITGAADALSFPFYQVRSANPRHFFDAYSLYMHCDYTMADPERFAQSVIKNHHPEAVYPSDEWDFAFYNLWRPVEYPAEKDPLVWVDAGSVDARDIIDYLPVNEVGKGKASVPLFNEAHKHLYAPDMTTDEVLILKQLDSRPGKAMVCPHTSFVDPTAPADARPRQSIDVRFVCMFPKEARQ